METNDDIREGNSDSGNRTGGAQGEWPDTPGAQVVSTTDESVTGEVGAQPSPNEGGNPSEEAKWERRQFYIQATIAVVGLATVVFYFWQLDEMKEATKAATQATELATLGSHLDLRAWVAPDGATGTAEEEKPWKITVRIKNNGKTFAKHATGVVVVKAKELADPDPDYEAEEAKAGYISNISMYAPNQISEYNIEFAKGAKLSKEALDTLRSPTVLVLVFGKVTYWDIFGCYHWTKFCYLATPGGVYYDYGPYNDADNNCGPKTK